MPIDVNIIPSMGWKTIYGEVDGGSYKNGATLYPDKITFRPQGNSSTAITWVDKYNREFLNNDFNIIMIVQLALDTYQVIRATGGTTPDIRRWENTLSVRDKLFANMGLEKIFDRDLYRVVNEELLPFQIPTDEELGKNLSSELTEGTYPYSGLLPDITEINTAVWSPIANGLKRYNTVLKGEFKDYSDYLPNSTSGRWKLPPLFVPIIGYGEFQPYNEYDGCSVLHCTYLGIEAKK